MVPVTASTIVAPLIRHFSNASRFIVDCVRLAVRGQLPEAFGGRRLHIEQPEKAADTDRGILAV